MRVYKCDIRAYRCERCGKNFAFEDRLKTYSRESRLYVFTINGKHLCEDCEKNFREWFSECEKESRG